MNRIFTITAATVALVGSLAASPVFAAVQEIAISNDGRNVIHYVHISPVDWESWEEDLLGEEVILPGDDFLIELTQYEDACLYDVLVVFDTPAGLEDVALWEVDLCENASIAADEWEIVVA